MRSCGWYIVVLDMLFVRKIGFVMSDLSGARIGALSRRFRETPLTSTFDEPFSQSESSREGLAASGSQEFRVIRAFKHGVASYSVRMSEKSQVPGPECLGDFLRPRPIRSALFSTFFRQNLL